MKGTLGCLFVSLCCLVGLTGCSAARSERIKNAIASGSVDEVRKVLANASDVNSPVQTGSIPECYSYPLHLAVASGSLPVIDYLIDLGADPAATDFRNRNAFFALIELPNHDASKDRIDQIVDKLLTAGVDIDANTGKFPKTPLMYAAYLGHGPLIRSLVEHGADVTIADTDGKTASDLLRPEKFSSKQIEELKQILSREKID